MACVTDCGASAISIDDTQLWSKPICRSFNYYVDPDGANIIELGTKTYPFKNIGLPFVEVLNYHSHTDRTITVYVKENTENFMLYKSNYIIDITQVTVESYAESSFDTPAYAIIYMKNSGVTLLNPKTVFNILSNTDLRLDSVVQTSEIDEAENTNSK